MLMSIAAIATCRLGQSTQALCTTSDHIGGSHLEMKNRITITNWRETPDDDVNLVRTRPKIFECWGHVKERGFEGSGYTRVADGVQYDQTYNPTHVVTIRNPSDVLITPKHWVYTTRRFDRREWYRIIHTKIENKGRDLFLVLYCTIDEVSEPKRADPAVLDLPDTFEQPPRETSAPVTARFGEY
jgi:hypothetical protein